MSDVFKRILGEWHHHHHHDGTIAVTVTLEPAPPPLKGTDAMALNIANILENMRATVGNADQWLSKIVQEHIPQIMAEVEKYQQSPIIQAMEDALLPPEVETQVAAIITTLAKQFPAAPAVEAPPADQPPAEEVPQG